MFTQKTASESPKTYLDRIPTRHHIERLEPQEIDRFYGEFYLPARPVILTNALAGWGCLERWSIDFLERTLGRFQHRFSYENRASIAMNLGDYLRLASKNAPPEAYQGLFPELPSTTEKLPYVRHFGPLEDELLGDYKIESLFPTPARVQFVSYLFCGVPSTKTNCHYDWSHNFVGVVHGQKHVALLPPSAEAHMTVPGDLRAKMAKGDCDFFEDPFALDLGPDEKPGGIMMHEHPVFESCPELYYSPLFAGDLVFFPAYWYHYFHNVESTISITTQTALRED